MKLASTLAVVTLAALVAAPGVASAAPAAVPSDAHVVGPSSNHTTIRSAVSVSSEGDVILIEPGTYPEDIDLLGVGLTLVANGTVVIRGSIEVRDTPAKSTVLLAGLQVRTPLDDGVDCVRVVNAMGAVRVVDCLIAHGAPGSQGTAANRVALRAVQCRDLAVIDSEIAGPWGSSSVYVGFSGGSAVFLTNVERASFMRSICSGGAGGPGDDASDSSGGDGIIAQACGSLHLDYSALMGGGGGQSWTGGNVCRHGGDGGAGLRVLSPMPNSTLYHVQGIFSGGDGGSSCTGSSQSGADIASTVAVVALDEHPASLATPLIVRTGTTFQHRIAGLGGDRVRLFRANSTKFRFAASLAQSSLLGGLRQTTLLPTGTIMASQGVFGALFVPGGPMALPPGSQASVTWYQAVLERPGGDRRLSSARPLIVLDASL